jgi:hypothetical protein
MVHDKSRRAILDYPAAFISPRAMLAMERLQF